MLSKIAEVLKKNPKDSEFDNLLYLVRCFLLLMIPYGIIITVIHIISGVPSFAIFTIAFILICVLLFSISYRFDPRFVALTSVLVVDVFSFFCAIYMGASGSFHLLLFMSLFIMWFDISRSMPEKLIWSMATGLAVCYVRAVEKTEITEQLFYGVRPFAMISYVNNVFCVIGLSVIAWFFCTQFADVERKLYLSNKELRKISHTDPLTKLMNRRYAEEEFAELEANYNKQDNLISIAIGDIDFFKTVNDTYGHDAGDYVLSTLAGMFEKFMREYGFVARWGGEEFLFVFEHSNGDNAYIALEKLRADIEQTKFDFKDQQLKITMTFGVEEYGSLTGMDNTIKEADKKLYLGKSSGRNKVVY